MPEPRDFIAAHGYWDPLKVMRPEFADAVNARIKAALARYVEGHITYDQLPDVYYLREFMAKWLGAARLLGGYGQSTVSPINSPSMIQYAFCLSHEERLVERTHFELL